MASILKSSIFSELIFLYISTKAMIYFYPVGDCGNANLKTWVGKVRKRQTRELAFAATKCEMKRDGEEE